MIDLPNDFAQTCWWLFLAAFPVALFSGYRLLVIEKRERAQRIRLEQYRGAIRNDPQEPSGPSFAERILILLTPIIGIVELKRLVKSLTYAGFRGHVSLSNFIATKAMAAAILMATASIFPLSSILLRLGLLGTAFFCGWRLPDLILRRVANRRRLRLEQGMPDALDLLVICAEAGLSLNQAIENISEQLKRSNKDIADEFVLTSAEMRILPDFGTALDNLVERTGLDHLRSLVATLKQSLKYGTPLAESLRTIAAEMRAERNTRMEERAAKLPVLLAVPMMLFILPCLLMIIGTPMAIRIFDTYKNIALGH